MVKVKFSGSPSEQDSPFCKENENTCQLLGNYIESKNGSMDSKYTAWAIKAKGKFGLGVICNIVLEKKTMNDGNLFRSSTLNKYEKTKLICTNYSCANDFKINPKGPFSFLETKLNKNIRSVNENYLLVLDCDVNYQKIKVVNLLVANSKINKLEKVQYSKSNKILEIEFNTLLTNFNLIDQIIQNGERQYNEN